MPSSSYGCYSSSKISLESNFLLFLGKIVPLLWWFWEHLEEYTLFTIYYTATDMQESRVLQDCIDNIERVSTVRLEVTQKVIDITLQLDNLENKEY